MTRSSLLRRAATLWTAVLLLAATAQAVNHQVAVGASGNSFSPKNLTINAGDSVTWTNSGGFHNVRADNDSFRCANGCDGEGGNGAPSTAAWSVTRTFNSPGALAYYCEVHGNKNGIGMSGTLTVQGAQNAGTVQLTSASASVGEGAGPATITVSRTNGDDGAAAVHYATSNGTATAGSDYTAVSGNLNWADQDDTSKSFVVPILDDSNDESNEAVNITLSNATGASLGSPSSAVLTIVDDDAAATPGNLRFSVAAQSVGEAAGSVTVTVRRQGGSSGAVSVAFSTSDASAMAGSDYQAAAGSVSFADGNSANKTFTINIVDDALSEGNETLNVALSNPTGGASLGSPSSQTITILDDDDAGSAGSLNLTTAQQSVDESAGVAGVTVQRQGGSSGPVSVDYATGDGSAAAGSDYTSASGSVTFGDGDAANKTVNIPIVDDSELEGDETINLLLANPTGGASLGSPSSQTITILDDDTSMEPCVPDEQTLCLQNGRFQARVEFQQAGGQLQTAHAIPFTDRAGLFWFFNENNVEMLLKVLNACVPPFNRYWVFFAATTNVEFALTVADTQSGRVRRYDNPQGTAALPIQDTGAFDTCP